MSKLANISMKASGVCAGVAFFGGLNANFQLIVKCPIHIYSVIKKNLQGSNHDWDCRFFSGSIDIADLVLPQYRGVFVYRDTKGKVKKYHSAFVYPLMADYMVSDTEYAGLKALCSLMDLAKYEYYDKQNRNIRQILNCFELPGSVTLDGFEESFCCLEAIETK